MGSRGNWNGQWWNVFSVMEWNVGAGGLEWNVLSVGFGVFLVGSRGLEWNVFSVGSSASGVWNGMCVNFHGLVWLQVSHQKSLPEKHYYLVAPRSIVTILFPAT